MAKVLFHNGRIWRNSAEWNSWMIVDQVSGKVDKCGSGDAPAKANFKEMHDLKQQWVFPGFHDSHMHAAYLGARLNKKSYLQSPTSVAVLKTTLKHLASSSDGSDDGWFVGYGWDHLMMDRMPTKDDLDEVIPNRPVLLYRVCYHIAVANSKALALAGITLLTKNPKNGVIDRFPNGHEKSGEPTGVVREDGGVGVVKKVIPPVSSEQKKENILAALHDCLRLGITSIHTVEECYWNEYVSLAKEDKLPIHCYFSAVYSDMDTENCPSAGEEHNNLSCKFIKIFVDGALNTQTAALSMPYVGSNATGVLQFTRNELEMMFTRVNNAGYRLEIHVIGDRAAELVLDCLESCGINPDKRPILVHCQILRSDLLHRMKKLGVVPTIQPSFVVTDSKAVRKLLPRPLQKCIYPWKTLLETGIICGGSSDAPVESHNPIQGLYDAIFRTDLMSDSEEPFIKRECLTFQEAVALYTTGSAYADGVEDLKGKLECGYQADFVVLNTYALTNEPVNLPQTPELLKSTSVHEVWIKGKCAWKNLK